MSGAGRLAGLPGLALSLARAFRRQKKQSERLLAPLLSQAKAEDGTVGRRELYRVRNYAFRIPPSLGATFCLMRGAPMNAAENERLTLLGALSPVFDDFFDDEAYTEGRIREMAFRAGECVPGNDLEGLFLRLMRALDARLGERGQIDRIASDLIAAQTESRKQMQAGTSLEEIRRITCAKGGHTVLLYRAMLEHPLYKAEERAIHELGGFMQLVEDTVDLVEDLRSGIRTLPNSTEDVVQLYDELREKMEGAFAGLRALPYRRENVERTLYRTFVLCAPAFAHLRRLGALQERDGTPFCAECYEEREVAFREWRTGDVAFGLKLLYEGY